MSQKDGAGFFSSKTSGGKKTVRRLFLAAAVIAVAPQASLADEGGVSFWLQAYLEVWPQCRDSQGSHSLPSTIIQM